jgi:multidrug efflux system outer membrane protein
MRWLILHALLPCLLLGAPSSLAEPAAEAGQPGPGEGQPSTELPTFDVADPMLDAVPSPAQRLTSWQQALSLLRSNSTELRFAALRVEQANAASRQALARALPQLSAQANLTRHLLLGEGPIPPFTQMPPRTGELPNPPTSWQAAATLSVPVFAPQAWHDLTTAKEAIANQRVSARETERMLLAGIAQAIINVVTAERLHEVSRLALRAALSTRELNLRRAALGGGTRVDVLRAEQEVSAARAQVLSTAEAVRRAQEGLGFALGDSAAWSVSPDIKLDALVKDADAVCTPEADVNARTDVRAAEGARALAERRVESARYGYYPEVKLMSTAAVYDALSQTPNSERVTWTISGVLSWTLYDGGARYGAEQSAQAELGLAREQLLDVRRRASLEVQQAARSVAVAQASLEVSQQARTVAEETARLSKVAFINGSGTAFDLVDTERRQRAAELDLATREFDLVKASITLLLARASCDI